MKIVHGLAFSDKAYRCMQNACNAARKLGSPYVGTGHLLLAVMSAAGPATDALNGYGITGRDVHRHLRKTSPSLKGDELELSDAARAVLSLAHEKFSHSCIDHKSLVKALVYSGRGTARRILLRYGIRPDWAFRAAVDRASYPYVYLDSSEDFHVGAAMATPENPLSPAALLCVDQAVREAIELPTSNLSTGHLLLGILEKGGHVAHILHSLDIHPTLIRQRLCSLPPQTLAFRCGLVQTVAFRRALVRSYSRGMAEARERNAATQGCVEVWHLANSLCGQPRCLAMKLLRASGIDTDALQSVLANHRDWRM